MTRLNEPKDEDSSVARQLRLINQRLGRIEYTSLTSKEVHQCIDGVYDETDDLDSKIDERFEEMEERLDRMEAQMNGKLDAILQGLTMMNQDGSSGVSSLI
jgi:hypothetical protein